MPQIYSRDQPRRRTLSNSSISSSSSIATISAAPLQVDDSIVLSDLVRTGEASQLRRRGAMRIDHNSLSTSRFPESPISTSPNPIAVNRPAWDSDLDHDDDDLASRPFSRFPRMRRRSSRRFTVHDTNPGTQPLDLGEYKYALFCGRDIPDPLPTPYQPSILPLTPPTSSGASQAAKSSGCGTLIHAKAAARSRIGMWSARSAATTAVVSLDAAYFDTREAAKFVRNSCGCVKEGVGCAVCGNPLGIRYIPCKSASEGLLCQQANKTSVFVRGPEGPQYWDPMSGSPSDYITYTFFPSAVTSSPECDLATDKTLTTTVEDSSTITRPIPIPSLSSHRITSDLDDAHEHGTWRFDDITVNVSTQVDHVSSPPYGSMIMDRYSASSPTPLSDYDDDDSLWNLARLRTFPHTRRPRIYPAGGGYEDTALESSPVSFYQQQVINAWQCERDRVWRMSRRRSRGFDPDGEALVWGSSDSDILGAALLEPGSPDKSTDSFVLPGR